MNTLEFTATKEEITSLKEAIYGCYTAIVNSNEKYHVEYPKELYRFPVVKDKKYKLTLGPSFNHNSKYVSWDNRLVLVQ